MNYLFNKKLSRRKEGKREKEEKELQNKDAQMLLNCVLPRVPGHSSSCHHQRTEGAAGTEG